MSAASETAWAEWFSPEELGHFRRRRSIDRWFGRLLPVVFLVAIIPILDLVYWVSQRSLPTFTWAILTTNPTGNAGGLYGPLVGTVYLLLMGLAIAVPLGILAGLASGVFLPHPWGEVVRGAGDLLVGTPSVILGYFGYFALVLYLGWGASLLAGGVTLGIFMLPYVARTSDQAFSSVPTDLRDAALGAGARLRQYAARIAFPIALPQVLSGIFLAAAIGIGETAPLLWTALFSSYPPTQLSEPTGYLTGLIWNYFDEPPTFGTEVTLAFQAALILIAIVVAMNVIVRVLAERSRRKLEGLYG